VTTDDIRQRLARIDAAALCDANKCVRVMDPGIRPVGAPRPMVGRAFTVRCRGDFLTVLRGLQEAEAGDVLVVDAGGGTVAGELFAAEAARKGLAGIVVDGACRDTAKLAEIDLPYYARSISPMAGLTDRLFDVRVPVTCGGVTVRPGEWVVGDRDGIVVASDEELSVMLPRAEAIQTTEAAILERIGRGESLFDMINYAEHVEAIRQGQPSRLGFRP
jgi:RraA family protein